MNNDEQQWFPRRLQIDGGSLKVAIPSPLYKPLGWSQGKWVAVRREGDEIVLSHLHLGQSGEPGSPHTLVPRGKHGKRFREENAAKES